MNTCWVCVVDYYKSNIKYINVQDNVEKYIFLYIIYVSAQDEIPSIMQLIIDVVTTSFNNLQNINSEISLKSLSAMLITIYGHNPQKVLLYLHNCKSVIELTLKSQLKALFKEVCRQLLFFVVVIFICLQSSFMTIFCL